MEGSDYRVWVALVALVVTLVHGPLPAVLASVNYPIEVHAIQHQQAPGTPDGVIFWEFSLPSIGPSGHVAFYADVRGDGVERGTNSTGVWVGTKGLPKKVARAGEFASGTVDDSLFAFSLGSHLLPVNDSGDVAISTYLTGPNVEFSNQHGVWHGNSRDLQLIVRDGQVAPSTEPDTRFVMARGEPGLNDQGHVVFPSRLIGPLVTGLTEDSNWLFDGSGLRLLVRTSTPFTSPGLNDFKPKAFSASSINRLGEITFEVDVEGPGIFSDFNDNWVVQGFGSQFSEIVRTSAPFQPIGGDARIKFLSGPIPNHAGQFAVALELEGTDLDDTNNNVNAVFDGGLFRVAAREGDPAPGMEQGFTIKSFSGPIISGNGQTAFNGLIDGPDLTNNNNRVMYMERDDQLLIIARAGDQGPGLVGVERFLGFAPPVLNGNGQIAFVGEFDVEPTRNPKLGLWATDLDGRLQLIARAGDVIDIDADPFVEELRTIQRVEMISASSGEDGYATSFNHHGQIAFKVLLEPAGQEGPTYAIVVATIPEPTTIILLSITGGCIAHRRRRWRKSANEVVPLKRKLLQGTRFPQLPTTSGMISPWTSVRRMSRPLKR